MNSEPATRNPQLGALGPSINNHQSTIINPKARNPQQSTNTHPQITQINADYSNGLSKSSCIVHPVSSTQYPVPFYEPMNGYA